VVSKTLDVLRFYVFYVFQNPKIVTFYVFVCFVAYVFTFSRTMNLRNNYAVVCMPKSVEPIQAAETMPN